MQKTPDTKKTLPLPPGSFGLPIIGETISFLKDSKFAQKRQKKYGKIFKTSIFGRPTVYVYGADANRFLFSNENKYFVVTLPTSAKKLLGSDSLSIQTGNFHQQRRKLIYQAFQPRALANYIPTIARITADYLDKWEYAGKLIWYPELRNYTFDIACSLLIGTDNASQTSLGHLFEDWCAGLFTVPIALPWTKFGRALYCRKQLLKEIERIVLQRKKVDNLGEDALGILLQAQDEQGNRLPLEELKDQVLLLLFAGHETLTSAIASFCLLMAQHPDVFERVREEQKQFSDLEPLTLEKLKQMTYLEQVLKEVLRFISPVGGGFREVIQDCDLLGYSIPKNWIILYQINLTHQDEEIYEDSERFDPDRFSLERAEDKQKSFGYVPFGGGLRECLGKEFARLEMKIFAAMLARNYEWKLLPEQDLELETVPTPRPRDGLRVNFSRRIPASN